MDGEEHSAVLIDGLAFGELQQGLHVVGALWVQARHGVDATTEVQLVGHIQLVEQLVAVRGVQRLGEADALAVKFTVLKEHGVGLFAPLFAGLLVGVDVKRLGGFLYAVLLRQAAEAVIKVPCHVDDRQDERVDRPCGALGRVHAVIDRVEVDVLKRPEVAPVVGLDETHRTHAVG